MEEKENVSVFSSAIKAGLIIGLSFVLVIVLMYIIDVELLAYPWLPLIAILIITIAIVILGVKFRNENGGYLSYGKAYIYCLLAFAVTTLLSDTFNVLLFNVIDPELITYIGDVITERTIESMKEFGQTDAEIDRNYDVIKARSYNQLRPLSFLIRYFILLFIYAVITLLIATIVKRSEPVEDVY